MWPKTHYKNESVNRDSYPNERSEYSALTVFLEELYCRIPCAISCSNYRNCAKMRGRPRFDRRSHWSHIVSRKVLLTVTLELGILTSLRITVTLAQRLEQTVLAYRPHINLSHRRFEENSFTIGDPL